MNIILGSGLIGNLAKKILGEEWEWFPFKKSRYYSFDTPYADNFVIYDQAIDEFMRELSPTNSTPVFYKRPVSYQGQLMYQDLPIVLDPYLQKVYGEAVPAIATKLIKSTFTIYPMTAQTMLRQIERGHMDIIRDRVDKFGDVRSIDLEKKVIRHKNGETGFDRILSTIPLNAFYSLCGMDSKTLQSKPICYYYLTSDVVDLEGAEQALVADSDIRFFKVQQLEKGHFVFWTFDPLENPLQYFGTFLNYRIEIMEAKRIDEAMPLGDAPNLSRLQEYGIYCVGSNAQWDDFMDISSCISRLLRLSKEM